jgi:opacity protein-like surface antigen
MSLKRILLVNVFLLGICLAVVAQDLGFKLDNKSTNRVSDYVGSMRLFSFRVDGSVMNLFNPAYFQGKSDETISSGSGMSITLEQRIWLFRLDWGLHYHSYSIDDLTYKATYGTDKTEVGGMDLFLSYILMPDWGKISRIFSPYIGIGYQTASLKAKTGKDENTKTVGSLGIGGPAWKGGLHINFTRKFFLSCEYKQSLDMKSPKAHNTLLAGLGWGF